MQPQDAIDFTDNDIQTLGNFPLSPRIQTLLLARNRISTVQPNLPNAIPNLKNLVLASNQLAELSDLDVLGKFARLTHLVLADNPVTKKEVGSRNTSRVFKVRMGEAYCVRSTTDIGSSGGVPRCGSSITRRSSRRSGRRPPSYSARQRSPRSWLRR